MSIPSWLAPAAVVCGFALQLAALWRVLPRAPRLPLCLAGALLVFPAALWQHDALLLAVQILLLPPLWYRMQQKDTP